MEGKGWSGTSDRCLSQPSYHAVTGKEVSVILKLPNNCPEYIQQQTLTLNEFQESVLVPDSGMRYGKLRTFRNASVKWLINSKEALGTKMIVHKRPSQSRTERDRTRICSQDKIMGMTGNAKIQKTTKSWVVIYRDHMTARPKKNNGFHIAHT